MKITYEFVTGDKIEIEVSDEWGKVLVDMNRKEYNEEKKETRRHYKLDITKEGSGCLADQDVSVEDMAVDDLAASEICEWARRNLTRKQFDAFISVCINGMSETEYSSQTGTKRQSVHESIVGARKKLKNFVEHTAF